MTATRCLLAFLSNAFMLSFGQAEMSGYSAEIHGTHSRVLGNIGEYSETNLWAQSLINRVNKLESIVEKQADVIEKYGKAFESLEGTLDRHLQENKAFERALKRQERKIGEHLRIMMRNDRKIETMERVIDKHERSIEEHGRIADVLTHQVEKLIIQMTEASSDTDNKLDMSVDSIANNSYLRAETPRQFRRRRGIREVPNVAFSAYVSHGAINNLGVGLVIKYDHVITNDDNAYNFHTGIFTVPSSGTYIFIFYCNTAHTNITLDLVADDVHEASCVCRPAKPDFGLATQGGGTVILHLNQGISVWIENHYAGGSLYSSSDHRWVTFSGFLLY